MDKTITSLLYLLFQWLSLNRRKTRKNTKHLVKLEYLRQAEVFSWESSFLPPVARAVSLHADPAAAPVRKWKTFTHRARSL